MNSRSPVLFGLRMSIALSLVLAVCLMGAATVAIVVNIGADAARRNAETLFSRISETIGERTDSQFKDTISLARYASFDFHAADPVVGDGTSHNFLSFMLRALRASPNLYSIYVGDVDGSFLQVIATRGDQRILAAHEAPSAAEMLVRTITGTNPNRVQQWTFLDAQGKLLSRRQEVSFNYVPAERPWFKLALGAPDAVLGEPYTFNSLKEPGVTASIALAGGQKVLGVDLTLRGLQQFIDTQVVSPKGGVMLLDSKKNIMAKSANFERRPGWLTKNASYRVAGQALELVLTAPGEDFEVDYQRMELGVVFATILLVLLLIPFTFLFTTRLTRIMNAVSTDVERACRMDFSGESPQGSRIREFDTLARGFGTMKATLARETQALRDAQLKLNEIVDAGTALSTMKDAHTLCQKIIDTAMKLTNAEGGTLYLYNSRTRQLEFNIMVNKNENLKTHYGGTSPTPIPAFIKPVNLYSESGDENHNNVSSHTFLTGKTVNIPDAYEDLSFDFSGTRKFDEGNKYRSQSFLNVPLIPLGGDKLGVLQLINARSADNSRYVPFRPDMQSFVEALAASAATALYNNQLIDNLEKLFDAIIDVINSALSRKSPYTGGHCVRVPIIAIELAKVTSAVTEGEFAGFSLSKDELKEFQLAAKLHDVGKITTPEYVVDKSTKLETIYNRIHEIRARFEIIYRDAVIKRHETVMADPGATEKADAALVAFKQQLDEEWLFLGKSNLGGEFLSPDKVEMIKTIGARTWLRYFDDRVGLSWEEEERLREVPKSELPCLERLLDDKPIHVFPRKVSFSDAYTSVDAQANTKVYDFKTPVPPLLYNQGEIYNLSIGRGTLTNEEHFKIKEHVMQTILMLDQLPWPKGQSNVTTIAGEHHETLNGSGYPYQKKSENLSMQSRILTIADIFEALTASDRPYKTPKKLSEAVKVLSFFKKNREIDAELFDLFLTSGVYKKYADAYIPEHLRDEVDINQYLGALQT